MCYRKSTQQQIVSKTSSHHMNCVTTAMSGGLKLGFRLSSKRQTVIEPLWHTKNNKIVKIKKKNQACGTDGIPNGCRRPRWCSGNGLDLCSGCAQSFSRHTYFLGWLFSYLTRALQTNAGWVPSIRLLPLSSKSFQLVVHLSSYHRCHLSVIYLWNVHTFIIIFWYFSAYEARAGKKYF